MTSEADRDVSALRPTVDFVERALDEVGDRWIFLILREAFFGVKRFDEIRANTGASPAVLADRLKRLVANGLFTKTTYSAHANRYEYHLTDKARDLYPIIVLLMQWGDTWLSGDDRPPLALTHECGTDGPFALTCPGCGDAIDANGTGWHANLGGDDDGGSKR